MKGSRIIAQDLLTRNFECWDVPLEKPVFSRELSGSGVLTGNIGPQWDLPDSQGRFVLREWSTALYYERDGIIRGGGIVTRLSEPDESGRLRVEAPGFSTYPHGMPYLGDYQPGLGADPLDVVREIWSHLQGYPNGNIGVSVSGLSSDVVLDKVSYTTNENDQQVEIREPYTLGWWENRDCGQTIDSMLRLAETEFYEHHTWNADHSDVETTIVLGRPVGSRRTTLRFVEGENVLRAIPFLADGEEFAQNVVGLGAGEGRDMVRYTAVGTDDHLRRVAVVADKTASQAEIEELAKAERSARTSVLQATELIVRDHPNARLSSLVPGDLIQVEADLRRFGRLTGWVRVLAIDEDVEAQTARLHVS